jgi:signal transduction histidine kinase
VGQRVETASRRREDWLQASLEIQQQLLTPGGEEPLEHIARQARTIADADVVTVVLPTPDPAYLRVEVASGALADEIHGYTFPADNTMTKVTLGTGRPVMLADAAGESQYPTYLTRFLDIGPIMVVPLIGAQHSRGALALGRLRGRRPFENTDLDLATAFAHHAAMALELADARADQQRMLLLQDRDRIARDLHDHVIQRLFVAGMTLQGTAFLPEPERAVRVDRVVTDLDEVIAQIRTAIFGLRGALGPQDGSVRARVLEVVAELGESQDFAPRVRFVGAIDAAVGPGLADDIVAVARETLTNAARHAQADLVEISLTVTAETLSLDVVDNGVGLGGVTRRSGLRNLRQRAENHGGTLELLTPSVGSVSPQGKGTHVRWTIPL